MSERDDTTPQRVTTQAVPQSVGSIMTTYVIGDIQGCFEPFQALLNKVGFDPCRDRLWSVGDLINRGSDNLGTLRWFHEHRNIVQVVLGNHDLHLLAHYHGVGRKSRSDNFGDILQAPDAEVLLIWLAEQPLMIREGEACLVHAGIPPCWSSDEALGYANEVSQALQSEDRALFFQAMYGNEPCRWSTHLSGWARLRSITNYFTRMRYCTADGGLDLTSKGPEPDRPTLDGQILKPWFAHPHRLHDSERVFFGHWASLEGRTGSDRFVGLDTGCVWGRCLTLCNLDTGERFNWDCAAQ